jgi:hypothetical protein
LFDFADTCVFAKQSLGPILCDLPLLTLQERSHTRGSPSSEVTGTFCRVPSPQITRAPEATRLAYVCPFTVRSPDFLPTEAFLGSRLHQTPKRPRPPRWHPLSTIPAFSLWKTSTALHRDNQRPALTSLLRPPCGSTYIRWFRTIHLIPIAYALRPRLRLRLTRGGRAWPRNP